jgi:hypothetical protein
MAPVFRPPRKGCAVRLMRVGLASPILAAIGRASFHRHPVSSGAAFAESRPSEISNRNHRIRPPGCGTMFASGGAYPIPTFRQGVPETAPCRPRRPLLAGRVLLSYRRGLRRSGHLADPTMAAWQMYRPQAGLTVAYIRGRALFPSFSALPSSLQAAPSHRIGRGLRSAPVRFPKHFSGA